ncbi:MAG: RNA polymerase factor sigma-54 [Coriobacteriales bacterium]
MDLSQHIEQRQELHLTTELRQGIAILQMSASELSEHVKQQVEENPFLDDDDWEWPKHPHVADSFQQTTSVEALRDSSHAARPEDPSQGFDSANAYDSLRPDRYSGVGEGSGFEQFAAQEETLQEHLLGQLSLLKLPDGQRTLCEYLVGCLDGNGYLRESLEELEPLLGATKTQLEHALGIIQGLEPAGVGARSLGECLALQVRARGLMDATGVRVMLEKGLPHLGQLGPAQLTRELGISLAEVDAALEVLRSCNPHPGAQYGHSSRPIWPEVVVEADPCAPGEEPRYSVRMQDFFLPHLKVNNRYRTLAASERDGDAAAYLGRKLKEADSLLDGIAYRKATLYKVACAVVELQAGFIAHGFRALRPLAMEEVARVTGLSESTVSRVANGNYVQTPRGLFELRFFFQRAADAEGSGIVAQASAKHRIRELVELEDPRKPLSDQRIAELLAEEGMQLARRTVSKYRAELGIPAKAFRTCG